MHNRTTIPGRPGLGPAILASILLLILSVGTQAQTTVTNGLVAYWNLDESLWDSVSNFHGSARGGTPLTYVDGKAGFGKSLLLDGTNFVEITGGTSADNLTFEAGSVSIAGWFKVGTFDKSWQALVARGEGSSWRVARNSSGAEMSYAGGLTDALGVTPVDDGAWHHFVAISDPQGTAFGTAIYIDGQLDGMIEGTAALTRNSGNNVMIGENPDARGRQWNGEVDDIGIWNRVLTDTEIAALYANGTGKALSSLLPPIPEGNLTIVTQPANVSVNENGVAVFSVVASTTGSTAPIYQWRKNGVTIPNATDASYTTPFVTVADNGAKFSVRVSVPGKDLVSTEATLTVTQDSVPPTVVIARGDVLFTTVTVRYSEPVGPTAEAKANYALDKGVTINSVTRIDATSVKLATTKMAESTDYTLTINGVKDGAGNTIAADTKVAFKSWVFYRGGVLHKFWENNTANNIAALQSDPRFPDSPTFYTLEPMWEYGPDGGNESGSNYGNQLIGWFTPSQSGNYVFFTNSDDPSNLYLSTDEDPANKKLIAQETGWSNARNWVSVGSGDLDAKRSDTFFSTEWPDANTITLQAGKRYYLESLHTEGGGGDSVAVTFKMDTEEDPVNLDAPRLAGSLIGTYLDPVGASVTISQQPQSVTTAANSTVTFTVAATGTSSYGTNLIYQWQKAAAGSTSFTDIAGATAASYTTPFLAASNNGEKYRVIVNRPPISETSAEATVTITSDASPPIITAVEPNPSQVQLILHFNEPLDNATATALANYAIDNGLTVSSVALTDQQNVVLTTAKQTVGTLYTVTVTNVKDLAGNVVAANTKATFYPATIATGAVAYWNFDGNFADWFGDFDGTERGTSPIEFVNGKSGFGQAIRLLGPSDSGGANQFVEITGGQPDDLAFAGGSMSISAWFTVDAWDKSWQALVAKGESSNWRIHRSNAEDVMGFAAGAAGDTPAGTGAVADGQWHHLVAIKDAAANASSLWIDGVLDASLASVGALASNGQRMMIGENPDARNRYWHGLIDDVAVWNRPLLESEVAQLHASGAGKPLGTFLPPPGEDEITTTISRAGNTLTIRWTPAGGTLETTPALGAGATWTTVGTANPATVNIGTANAYYRVRK